jgi:hypothetical protein
VILCLHCRRLWPRESRFCGTCHHSFGGRVCPKQHLSPSFARCCTTCGSSELSRFGRSLSLNFISLAITLGVALIGTRLLLACWRPLLNGCVWLLETCFALAAGLSWEDAVAGLLSRILPFVVVLVVVVALLPKRWREWAGKTLTRSAGAAVGYATTAVRLLTKVVFSRRTP